MLNLSFNPTLVALSALFYLALTAALYVGTWLVAAAVLRAARRRLTNVAAKRVLLTALVLPPVLAALPTASGATLRHLHGGDGGGAHQAAQAASSAVSHHTEGCRAVFDGISSLGSLGGGLGGVLLGGGAWLLVGIGLFFVLRLVGATLRLERGVTPFLLPPSAPLVRSLDRVRSRMRGAPAAGRFFECPIPSELSSVLGLLRPRCILSRDFVAGAPDEEIDAVVAHEAAHLRSRDVTATFVVGVLNCLFFFFRPVRLLARRWREAAELAADDAAVAATRDPLSMAAAILKVHGVRAPSGSPVSSPVSPRLPAVALPFADEAACSPSRRVERLIEQAERAALAPPAESRLQVVAGWAVTAALALLGGSLLLSPEAACVSHCTLESMSRLL